VIRFTRDFDPDARLGPPPYPPLVVRGLSAGYGRGLVLEGADLDISAGTLVAVVGPNGAGKSTLLKACLELVPDASGLVAFFGRPLDQVRELVAYVPQREAVDWDFPITALEVVTMGRFPRIGWFRRVTRAQRELARAALDRVGLADLARRQIGALSGGQQQRVFLARALVSDAQLYLLDEPTSGVDAVSHIEIERVLRELAAEGHAVVCVHHDLDTVRRTFDQAVVVSGTVLAQGPVDDVLDSDALRRAYTREPIGDEASE
jgi:manganese/zinc/iron transport system ATP- binding protein